MQVADRLTLTPDRLKTQQVVYFFGRLWRQKLICMKESASQASNF
jgi:hypothetical protein